uniref:Uncharacterized protein n=1 Tax=Setaria digitata TaxID=48799 RepID=A0A915Q6T9_9BILA
MGQGQQIFQGFGPLRSRVTATPTELYVNLVSSWTMVFEDSAGQCPSGSAAGSDDNKRFPQVLHEEIKALASEIRALKDVKEKEDVVLIK